MQVLGTPSLFWTAMECSGVSIIIEPSTGEANCTPSSVILARCSKDTICILGHHRISTPAVTCSWLQLGKETVLHLLAMHAISWLADHTLTSPHLQHLFQLEVLPALTVTRHAADAHLNQGEHHTWKPPESVSMPLGQLMKPCSPPIWATTSDPGRLSRWYVLPRMT